MDDQEILKTADEVIDALGGTGAASRITGQAVATVSNWRSRNQIPAAYFLNVSNALRIVGKGVVPEVFGIKSAQAVEAAE